MLGISLIAIRTALHLGICEESPRYTDFLPDFIDMSSLCSANTRGIGERYPLGRHCFVTDLSSNSIPSVLPPCSD